MWIKDNMFVCARQLLLSSCRSTTICTPKLFSWSLLYAGERPTVKASTISTSIRHDDEGLCDLYIVLRSDVELIHHDRRIINYSMAVAVVYLFSYALMHYMSILLFMHCVCFVSNQHARLVVRFLNKLRCVRKVDDTHIGWGQF